MKALLAICLACAAIVLCEAGHAIGTDSSANTSPTSRPSTSPATKPATRPIAYQPTAQALSQIIPEVKFENTTLEDAINFISTSCRVKINVDWGSLAKAGTIDRAKKTVSMNMKKIECRKALSAVLSEVSGGKPDVVCYDAEDTGIDISSPDHLAEVWSINKVYDTRALLSKRLKANKKLAIGDAINELKASIEGHIEQDRFENNQHRIVDIGGQLMISCSPTIHGRIAKILAQLGQQ